MESISLTWGEVLLCFVALRIRREGTEHGDTSSSQGSHRQEFVDIEETGNLSLQEVCSFVSEVILKPLPPSVGLWKAAPGWVTSQPCGLERFAYCDPL